MVFDIIDFFAIHLEQCYTDYPSNHQTDRRYGDCVSSSTRDLFDGLGGKLLGSSYDIGTSSFVADLEIMDGVCIDNASIEFA